MLLLLLAPGTPTITVTQTRSAGLTGAACLWVLLVTMVASILKAGPVQDPLVPLALLAVLGDPGALVGVLSHHGGLFRYVDSRFIIMHVLIRVG